MGRNIFFLKYSILVILFISCKSISGQKQYSIKADTAWIELSGLGFYNPSIIHGIDSLILKYDLRKERTKDYVYLLSIENESTDNYLFHITLMPRAVIERPNILGFIRIREQPFIIKGEDFSSLLYKTTYKELFYVRREWVEVNQRTQRWDTFGIEEFTSWTLSYNDGKISIIDEYFNPFNPSGIN